MWNARVLSEYNKRKKFIKQEWKDNSLKLENTQYSQSVIKWDKVEARQKKIYLKECSPIPRGNKFHLINKNEKCPIDEENVLFNIPSFPEITNSDEVITDFLTSYNNHILANEPLGLLNDNVFVELVQRLEEKYIPVSKRNTCSKMNIFKAISKHFYNEISPKLLMDRYDKLITEKKLDTFILGATGNSTLSGKEKFSKLFCRRCFVYACSMHSNDKEADTKDFSDNYRIMPKANNPCGDDCFLNMDAAEEQFDERPCTSQQASKMRPLMLKIENELWSLEEMELFTALRNIFKDNVCVIAKSMPNKNCKQIYQHFLAECPGEVKDTSFEAAIKHKKVSRSTKSRALFSAHMKANELEKPITYTPCNHSETLACNRTCPCVLSKNFCEKFCKCHSGLCLNRYIGCKCKTQCDNKRCPCYSYGRECDPDLCKSCGADKLETNDTLCQNINMQQGKRKHLLLAPSSVAGWGVFVKYAVKRNEYITEYCGEIITQDEANRRGKLYDIAKSSFLFDLNNEYVIDATFMGNKIRFANHSDKPNCYAKLLKVLGDHRIGIFAKQDIAAGEELFFDYKYGHIERLKFLCNDD